MENPQNYLSISQAGCRIGARVKVSGIVSKIENHGGLLFIDVKDKGNLIRALIIPDNRNAREMSKKIAKGHLVEIEGIVKECPVSTQDVAALHGNIEIEVEKISIISARDDEEYNRLIGILEKIRANDEKKMSTKGGSAYGGKKKII